MDALAMVQPLVALALLRMRMLSFVHTRCCGAFQRLVHVSYIPRTLGFCTPRLRRARHIAFLLVD